MTTGPSDITSVEAAHVVVATGSTSIELAGAPVDGARVIGSDDALRRPGDRGCGPGRPPRQGRPPRRARRGRGRHHRSARQDRRGPSRPPCTALTTTMGGNARSVIEGTTGTVKLVVGPDGTLLVGPSATELVAELGLATSWDALASELGAVIHAHPSLGEAIREAALAASGLPFHGNA